MSTERPYGWMWLRALEVSEQAERLQRRFLDYLGPRGGAVSWEPPVDVHETPDGITLIFALPGVEAGDIGIQLDPGALTVTATRPVRVCDPHTAIRRLEIPHGRFVRRVLLSGASLRVQDSRYTNGCLEIRLVRTQGAQ